MPAPVAPMSERCEMRLRTVTASVVVAFMTFLVRPATDADWPLSWPIIQEVAASQETFAMEAAPNARDMRASWMTQHPGRVVLASDDEGLVLGSTNMYAAPGLARRVRLVHGGGPGARDSRETHPVSPWGRRGRTR